MSSAVQKRYHVKEGGMGSAQGGPSAAPKPLSEKKSPAASHNTHEEGANRDISNFWTHVKHRAGIDVVPEIELPFPKCLPCLPPSMSNGNWRWTWKGSEPGKLLLVRVPVKGGVTEYAWLHKANLMGLHVLPIHEGQSPAQVELGPGKPFWRVDFHYGTVEAIDDGNGGRATDLASGVWMATYINPATTEVIHIRCPRLQSMEIPPARVRGQISATYSLSHKSGVEFPQFIDPLDQLAERYLRYHAMYKRHHCPTREMGHKALNALFSVPDADGCHINMVVDVDNTGWVIHRHGVSFQDAKQLGPAHFADGHTKHHFVSAEGHFGKPIPRQKGNISIWAKNEAVTVYVHDYDVDKSWVSERNLSHFNERHNELAAKGLCEDHTVDSWLSEICT